MSCPDGRSNSFVTKIAPLRGLFLFLDSFNGLLVKLFLPVGMGPSFIR